MEKELLKWAMELQALSQAGLTYTQDKFDQERFERIREIAVEMLAVQSPLPVEKIHQLFATETGYPTPKIDTRGAIFKGDKILLVQEATKLWSLPGGWVDMGLSLAENTAKEVLEEAGLTVVPKKIIALQDRNRHNFPAYAYSILKVFILCENFGGEFKENLETLQTDWFSLEALPELDQAKVTSQQIETCFAAYGNPDWQTQFD